MILLSVPVSFSWRELCWGGAVSSSLRQGLGPTVSHVNIVHMYIRECCTGVRTQNSSTDGQARACFFGRTHIPLQQYAKTSSEAITFFQTSQPRSIDNTFVLHGEITCPSGPAAHVNSLHAPSN